MYEIVPFSSDYRTSDTASLNASSDLVIAAGGGCSSGVAAPGGEGTFYAGVIYAAQSALATAAAARPNTKNVMILVSDGEANATASEGMETANAGAADGLPNYDAVQAGGHGGPSRCGSGNHGIRGRLRLGVIGMHD